MNSRETLWRAVLYLCICAHVCVQVFIFERQLFTEKKGKSQVLFVPIPVLRTMSNATYSLKTLLNILEEFFL